MKNNKALIIVGIVLLNIIVVFMISQSLLGKTSKYDQTLELARKYVEQDLCTKAIEEYRNVIAIKDSAEIRIEMINVYKKSLENGEALNQYSVFVDIISIVNEYQDNSAVYEAACEVLIEYNKYEECAKLIKQAKDLHVFSDKLSEYLEKIRYKYTKVYSMYTDVSPAFDSMYKVGVNGVYTFLTDEASPEIEGDYIYASSFSEGYAFVKVENLDGVEKCFVIDKTGTRQTYFEGVESSSGVGRAKDKKGNDILLLSCKIGDTYKYYDINGKEVFGEYAYAGRFRNNIAAVKDVNGKWKLINGSGAPISEKVFDDVVLNEFDDCSPKGLIIAKEGEQYHIYNLKAEQIGEFSCDDAKAFVDDYAAFKSGGLWGFVNNKGEVIIEPQYEDAKSFSNKMGAVKLGEEWYCINPKNEFVVEETYEDVDYLNDKGICFVKQDGYWLYLKMFYTEN